MSHDAHMCVADACAAIGLGRMSSHAHAHGLRREPGNSVCADATHAEARNPWSLLRLPDCTCCFCCDVRVCVTSRRCVLQTRADLCIAAGGAVLTWLRVDSSRANTHTYTCMRAHICGVSRKPRTQAIGQWLHTHMCVADARNPWSRFQLPGLCSAWCVAEARG